MTPSQLTKLLSYIDARIDEKIRDAGGRDSLPDRDYAAQLRELLYDEFGFISDRWGNPEADE